MKDEEIDNVLKNATQPQQHPDPLVLARIGESIRPSMRPVRPLPPAWLMIVCLVLVCAAVSLAGAARAGFFGFERMDWFERLLVFSTIVILTWLGAISFARQMIPASRHRISPGAQLALSSVALLAVFAYLFRDYHTDHFVPAGIACLLTGLLHAIPADLLCWLLLSRGFAVNRVSAGLVSGTLAGLAGVGMLELHCPSFQATHILVWHTAVVPVSAALSAMLCWALPFRGRSNHR